MGREMQDGKQVKINRYQGVRQLRSVINKQSSRHTEVEKSLIPNFLYVMQICRDLCVRHFATKLPLRIGYLKLHEISFTEVPMLLDILGELICTTLHFLFQINKQSIHFFSTN